MIQYLLPQHWIAYDREEIAQALAEAKASILSLRMTPYQRVWVEMLQNIQLKREIAGTSRIEGAEFTDAELDSAISQAPVDLLTRSQRQARSAMRTYEWLVTIPDKRPVNTALITELHRRIVMGADDDHCAPGQLRQRDENVLFGQPRHRGVEGGEPCVEAFEKFVQALQTEYLGHDILIQSLAAHYHLAAMHPFLDGNGRTARALEVLYLQRTGLRDIFFIPMSNYYYDEKLQYLSALAEVRGRAHDLTPFLVFGLKGTASQCRRLLGEINREIAKALYRNLMFDLFNRLKTPKKRVIAERQLSILKTLLTVDWIESDPLWDRVKERYSGLQASEKAFIRDVVHLLDLGAIKMEKAGEGTVPFRFAVRLEWVSEVTESDFMQKIKQLPRAKTYKFLQ